MVQTNSFRLISFLGALLVAFCLASCKSSGSKSSPSSAPTGFTVTPIDGGAIVTWNQDPNLDYWIFYAAAASITPQNYIQFPQPKVQKSVSSPLTITGLTNGTMYAFTMNSTQQAGPAGPATASIAITPSAAGVTWKAGVPITAANLNAVALNSSSIAVAVGGGGTVFSTTDFSTWTPRASNTVLDLNAITNGTTPADVATGPSASTLVAVGATGTIVKSGDAAAWSVASSGTSANLNGAAFGAALYVVVGDGGVILTSPDAVSWTSQTSGTTNNLYGVAFLNATFVAVGANGAILTSTDAVTWTAQSSNTSAALRGAAFGNSTYVVVGASGTILSSADGVGWTVQTPISQDLYSVAARSQFAAVGTGGTILYGLPSTSWTAAASGTSSDLRSVILAFATGFFSAGVAGANTISR